jgi:hypothetical protein
MIDNSLFNKINELLSFINLEYCMMKYVIINRVNKRIRSDNEPKLDVGERKNRMSFLSFLLLFLSSPSQSTFSHLFSYYQL